MLWKSRNKPNWSCGSLLYLKDECLTRKRRGTFFELGKKQQRFWNILNTWLTTTLPLTTQLCKDCLQEDLRLAHWPRGVSYRWWSPRWAVGSGYWAEIRGGSDSIQINEFSASFSVNRFKPRRLLVVRLDLLCSRTSKRLVAICAILSEGLKHEAPCQ